MFATHAGSRHLVCSLCLGFAGQEAQRTQPRCSCSPKSSDQFWWSESTAISKQISKTNMQMRHFRPAISTVMEVGKLITGASRKTSTVFALLEYRQLKTKYEASPFLKNCTEILTSFNYFSWNFMRWRKSGLLSTYISYLKTHEVCLKLHIVHLHLQLS